MDRRDWYNTLKVNKTHLRDLEDRVEDAEHNIVRDYFPVGIVSGLQVTETTPTPSLSVVVAAGVARDGDGHRIAVPAPQTVSLATDLNGNPTDVIVGNGRIVALVARFRRAEGSPWTDPTDVLEPVGNFVQDEDYELVVLAGTSVPVATPPAPPSLNSATDVVLCAAQIVSTTTAFLTRELLFFDRPAQSVQALFDASLQRQLEVIPSSPPNMKVRVKPGRAVVDDQDLIVTGQLQSPTITAPVSNPRIDLVYLASNGTIGVRGGTEAPTPSRPSSAGVVPLAFVTLSVGQVAIQATHLADARPWMRATTTVARVVELTASAAQTVINLPFTITAGANGVEVMVDGLVLAPSTFTEGSTTITLDTPLVGGESVVVRAEYEAPIGTPANHAASHLAGGSDALGGLSLTQVADDLSGLMVGGDIAFTPQSDATGKIVSVSPVISLVIGNRRLNAGAHNVSETEFGGSYPATTTLYVYAFSNLGAHAYEVSTTAPEPSLTWKNGTTTHRYVCTFFVLSDGKVLQFRKAGRHYTYRHSAYTVGFLNVTLTAAQTTPATVSLSGLLPPHARIATVRARVIPGNGLERSLFVRTPGDTEPGLEFKCRGGSATDVASFTFEVETDQFQQLEYYFDSGVTSGELDVLGFRE